MEPENERRVDNVWERSAVMWLQGAWNAASVQHVCCGRDSIKE